MVPMYTCIIIDLDLFVWSSSSCGSSGSVDLLFRLWNTFLRRIRHLINARCSVNTIAGVSSDYIRQDETPSLFHWKKKVNTQLYKYVTREKLSVMIILLLCYIGGTHIMTIQHSISNLLLRQFSKNTLLNHERLGTYTICAK